MSGLIGKDPDAGKDWRQEEKGMTEGKMAGWYHWLNGHEFEQAPGDGEGQRSLASCSPWGHKVEHDWVTEQQKMELHGISSKLKLALYKRHHRDNENISRRIPE